MICPITTTSYLLGTTFIGLGALAFASPAQAQLTFGVRPSSSSTLPSPATSTSKTGGAQSLGSPETQAFIYSKAGRDIVLGALLVLLQYRRNKPAVTAVMGLVAFAGLVDGLAVYKFAPSDLRAKT